MVPKRREGEGAERTSQELNSMHVHISPTASLNVIDKCQFHCALNSSIGNI